MLNRDYLRFSLNSVKARRSRSGLTALGIAVGIAAVLLLTSMGEGLHRFMMSEFSQFGTNLIGINPGKRTTAGVSGAIVSNVRPLTIDDAVALDRMPGVLASVPVVQGNGEVEWGERQRRTMIYGVSHDVPAVWKFHIASGQFLPDDDPSAARAFVVLGSKVKQELFGNTVSPLGKLVRVGGSRFRVVGIMESKGQLLGFDLDDAVYIPASRALEMFNRESLMEIDVLYRESLDAERVKARITKLLLSRHGGEDFSVMTQEQMLEVLNSVLNIITFAVGALGGISLFVGGVGILTIMTIAVKERTSEIGLLKAMGARPVQIMTLFLMEAAILAAIGGLAGLAAGWSIAMLIHLTVPGLPVNTPWQFVVLAELLAMFIGIVAGVMPAFRASRMNPVDALRSE